MKQVQVMIVIGLTGGVGSGKSTVSQYLQDKGCLILDADKIAREITEPGSETLEKLAEAFGADILDEAGRLRRKELAKRAFRSRDKQEILEKITHGQIYAIICDRIDEAKKRGTYKIAVVDAPMFFEAGLEKITDEVWTVSASEQLRIERVTARDGIEKERILDIIERQITDSEREARADFILDNSGNKEELYQQIDRLLKNHA